MIKLLDLLKEDNPFVPRGSKEEREKAYNISIQTKIQEYIKNGMKGDLDLSDNSITSLPSNLTRVGGDLNLYDTSITSLPLNLNKVEGDLNLAGAPITSLPLNLTVGRDLYLFHTPITTLPPNLTVGGNLDLYSTPLSEKYSKDEIRAMVPNVEGEIIM
jgi:hypothetical protein